MQTVKQLLEVLALHEQSVNVIAKLLTLIGFWTVLLFDLPNLIHIALLRFKSVLRFPVRNLQRIQLCLHIRLLFRERIEECFVGGAFFFFQLCGFMLQSSQPLLEPPDAFFLVIHFGHSVCIPKLCLQLFQILRVLEVLNGHVRIVGIFIFTHKAVPVQNAFHFFALSFLPHNQLIILCGFWLESLLY